MTVIRLADGSLLLHSPVALDPELRRELDAIGRVRFAVAPNRVHHLYAGEVAKAYPGARLWVAPGLERKRPDLVFVGVLGDEAPAEWKDEVDQVFFRGRPYENEVVFLHRASRTLIMCDLAFNFGPRAAAPTRLLMRLLRSYGRFGPSTLDPLLIRDRRGGAAELGAHTRLGLRPRRGRPRRRAGERRPRSAAPGLLVAARCVRTNARGENGVIIECVSTLKVAPIFSMSRCRACIVSIAFGSSAQLVVALVRESFAFV